MTQIQPITSSNTLLTINNNTTAVQVALRVRPLTQQDKSQPRFSNSTDSDVIKTFEKSIAIVPHQKTFQFDHVFDTTSTQNQVFTTVASNFVDRFIDGYNVTILAYGQTSSGKTYTMGTAIKDGSNPDQEGIIPRAMSALFQRLQDIRKETSQHNKRAQQPPTLLNTPSVSGLRVPKRSASSVKLRPVSLITPPQRRGSAATTLPTHHHTPSQQQQQQQDNNDKSTRYTVHVSFIEIYNEELIDLLNPAPPNERTPVTIREDTKGHIIWTGLKEVPVQNTQDVLRYLQMGTENRATGSTDMNAKSSRSHAIFSVTLKQEKWVPSVSSTSTSSTSSTKSATMQTTTIPVATPSTSKLTHRASTLNVKALIGQMEKQAKHSDLAEEDQQQGEWKTINSKFHFVDLAGSERLKRTAAQGDRRKEGININAGLLALGNVISALSDPTKKSTHVPYRDSKLTRLLQDSLGGNSTTLMIACVSPSEINLTETINTIKYAYRARNIRNKAERNEQEEWMTTDNLDTLRNMIQKLKAEVKSLKGIHHRGTPSPLSSTSGGGGGGLSSPTKSQGGGFTQHHGIVSPSNSSHSDGGDLHGPSTCPSMSATTNLTVPDTSVSIELFDSHHHHHSSDIAVMVSDLRRQIEELQNEVTVTRERNLLVERELLTQKQQQLSEPSSPQPEAFQHLVEPVIEEYEKSISGLESQLAMARAALSHSDQALQEQQAKIEEFQLLQENEVKALEDLKARLAAALDREHTNQSYCLELEAQLEKSVRDGHKDQQILSELREKIIKFKDMDEDTEQYISDLETRLSMAETERMQLNEKIAALSASTTIAATIETTVKKETADVSTNTEDTLITTDASINTDALITTDVSIDTEATSKHLEAMQQERDSLEKQLALCQTTCQELRQELYQFKEKVFKDQATQSEKYIDEESSLKITQLLTEKEFQVLELESALKEIEDLKLEQTQARHAHSEQVTRLENSVTSLKEQCLVYQEQLAQEQLQLETAKAENQANLEMYKLDLNAFHLVEEKQDAIIQGLEAKLEEMDHLVSSLYKQLEERNKTIQHLETENTTKTQIAADMQEQLEGILKDVCGMGMEKKQLEKVMYFMEGTLRLQEAKSDKSLETLEDIKHHYKIREEEIEEKRCTVSLLSAQKDELAESLQQAAQRASQGEEKLKTLSVELDETRTSLTKHVSLVQKLKEEQRQSTFDLQRVHALESRVQELDREIELHQKAKLEKQQELMALEKAVQNQLVQNETLIQTIAELENTIKEERALASAQDGTGMIAELENKLVTLQQAKKREDDVWKAQMEKTKEELYMSRKENQEYKVKIEQLTESLELVKKQLVERQQNVSAKQEGSARNSMDSLSQQEMMEKIMQLQEDNAQLLKHNDNLESQLVLQRGQLTLETKNLELELMKLTAANDRLEKEMEQVIPRSSNSTGLAGGGNNRDSMQFTSPPQTPRVSSPPPPPSASNSTGSIIHYNKLQRDISSSNIAKLTKSGSYRSVSTILQQQQDGSVVPAGEEEALKRLSTISTRSDAIRPSSSIRSSRTIINSSALPPPTAPPSNPLPPIPTPLPPLPNSPTPGSISSSHDDQTPGSPSMLPMRDSCLQRQDSTTSTSFSELMNATSSSANFTAEQYDKLIRSLQRKAQFAENDVRAHQEVITKLENQLSRSESSVREVKKQLDLLSREKQAYNLEIQNLRTQVTQIQSQQKTMTDEQIQERKELEEKLEQQKVLKEKAEKARRILENRMDELMNRKSKFICF